MSTESERLAIRRALYADAQRRGDPLATANAAARLRAHIGGLAGSELEAVRASRRNFGQAIRQARSRRTAPPLQLSLTAAIPRTPRRRFPLALVAVVALIALALASVLAPPFLDATEGGAGGAPSVASDPAVPIVQSRGRVVLAATTAVSVVEEPAATAPPETPASSAPAPPSGATGPAGSAAPSGSGTPGAGTGTGSGGGNGSGGNGTGGSPAPAPTATRTPAPTFAACFVSIPRGFARLCGAVTDARSGRGIAGVCVSLGPCTDQSTRTDPNGRWTFALPVGNGTLQWGLEFRVAGYRTASFTQTSRPGFISIPTQRLVAAP